MGGTELKKLFSERECLRIMEAVNALEAVIVSRCVNGNEHFDGLWLSGLCHSAWKCLPDDGTMPVSEKIRVLEDIRRSVNLPVIVDCDTGGTTENLCDTIKRFSGLASAVVVEDKCGIKRNSLYGSDVLQHMEDEETFSEKIRTASEYAEKYDVMLIARIESFIAGESMEKALHRADSYLKSGAEGIVIHSIQSDGKDVFEFSEKFGKKHIKTPLLMIPTVYNSFSYRELNEHGADAVIYANQLTRSAYMAMEKTASSILNENCSKFADEHFCVAPKKILETIEG